MSLSLIIKREFIAKVRNKSFIVMTFLSPILVVGMAVLIGYLASINNSQEVKIAVHDKATLLSGELKSDSKTKYINLTAMPLDKARQVASKDYDGLIYVPDVKDVTELKSKVQYISADSPNMEFVSHLEQVIGHKVTRSNLQALNFDYDKIEKAKADATVKLSKFDGEETLKEATLVRIIIGGLSGYLIMMFVIIYGNMVMRSVIEEKTNRIIEIIVSSVKPFKLMMGKIVGTSLAGVLQFVIWCVLGFVLFMVIGAVFNVQMGGAAGQVQSQAAQAGSDGVWLYLGELWKLPLFSIMVSFLVYFVGGFFLYSSLYAAIGAAVDSETDSQQFLLPILMPLMLAVYVGFIAMVTEPHGTVAVIFSYIPLTSPIVMMMRIPFGVSIWEVLLSVVILYATFFAIVWFAAKIYRIGILMYGKKPTYKEIFKWLKY